MVGGTSLGALFALLNWGRDAPTAAQGADKVGLGPSGIWERYKDAAEKLVNLAEKVTPREAARAWMASHRTVVDGWLAGG